MQSNTLTWGHTEPAGLSDTICIGLAAFQEGDVQDTTIAQVVAEPVPDK